MADWTQSDLANRTLELLGIKAAGQSVASEDFSLANDTINGIYQELRRVDHAPFSLTAIPDWAQTPLRDMVAADLAPLYGLPLQQYAAKAQEGERRIRRQTSGQKQNITTKANFF